MYLIGLNFRGIFASFWIFLKTIWLDVPLILFFSHILQHATFIHIPVIPTRIYPCTVRTPLLNLTYFYYYFQRKLGLWIQGLFACPILVVKYRIAHERLCTQSSIGHHSWWLPIERSLGLPIIWTFSIWAIGEWRLSEISWQPSALLILGTIHKVRWQDFLDFWTSLPLSLTSLCSIVDQPASSPSHCLST